MVTEKPKNYTPDNQDARNDIPEFNNIIPPAPRDYNKLTPKEIDILDREPWVQQALTKNKNKHGRG